MFVYFYKCTSETPYWPTCLLKQHNGQKGYKVVFVVLDYVCWVFFAVSYY